MDRLSSDRAIAPLISPRRGCRALFALFVRWRLRALGRRQLQQLDGRALGFDITVITDAVRGIQPGSMAAMTERWQAEGVHTTTSEALLT